MKGNKSNIYDYKIITIINYNLFLIISFNNKKII